MIDIINAKKEFKKYISNYNPKHPRVSLKIGHIERVANNCKIIAENLNLSEEEVKLAELIGLFHDLGRFEQVRIANTFSDKDSGINHGEYSAKVLFEDGLIRNYLQETKYDKIIRKAVLNHNRARIEQNLSEKELLFSKIIRDADKLDIFYTITFESFPAIFWYEDFCCEKINDKIINEFENNHFINYSDLTSNADQIMTFYAYIYDLYFDITKKILVERKYLDTFTQRVYEEFSSSKVHEQIANIEKIYKNYLNDFNN